MSDHAHIHLARLEPDSHSRREQMLLPRLAAAEQSRYRAFRAAARRQTWLAGRELLLAAVAQLHGGAEPALLLTQERGGVRYDDGRVHLNLSHSGEWLAAATAPLPVGIDIERLRPRGVVSRAAEVFCQKEVESLARQPDPLPLFYRLWTLKEAACKAAGLSIWDALHQSCFDLESGRCHMVPPFPRGPWHLSYGDFAPGWRLALALCGGNREVTIWRRESAGWAQLSLSDPGSVAGD